MSHASTSAIAAAAVFCSMFAVTACGPAATTDPPSDPAPTQHVPEIDPPAASPPTDRWGTATSSDDAAHDSPSIDATPTKPHPTGVVHLVQVTDSGFSPPSMTLSLGDTVEFDFLSSSHSVTSGFACHADGMFESGRRDTGENYRVTFLRTGVFPFYSEDDCERMTGALFVKN